jgi:coproporphyrinogen III oxidase
VKAEVPWIDWPLQRGELPETPVILDLLEFCASAVGDPILGSYHSYHHHHHMRWDRDVGLTKFVAEVNLLFRRNGTAFKLDDTGRAERILPSPVAQALGWQMFSTSDDELDSLLEYPIPFA